VCGSDRQFLELIEMRKRNDHGMSRSIGIGIENYVTMMPAVYDARFRVVTLLRQIAKNTARGLFRTGDVGVSPRGPEIIHGTAE
jgi:hypothetical protein